jgi:hypothetical protein
VRLTGKTRCHVTMADGDTYPLTDLPGFGLKDKFGLDSNVAAVRYLMPLGDHIHEFHFEARPGDKLVHHFESKPCHRVEGFHCGSVAGDFHPWYADKQLEIIGVERNGVRVVIEIDHAQHNYELKVTDGLRVPVSNK